MDISQSEDIYNSQDAIVLAGMSYQTYPFFENETLVLPTGYELRFTIQGSTGVTDPVTSVFGFLAEADDRFVLAFRGTATVADIDSDLDLFQIDYPFVSHAGKTHRGITHTYQSMRNALIEELNTCSSSKKLYITGHSLGGDLALLASLDIAINTDFKHPIPYTLAAGRIGDPTFVARFNETIRGSQRIYNVHDFIPTLPGEEYPVPFTDEGMSYRHVEQDHAIAFQKDNLFLNHRINCYFDAIGTEDPLFLETLRKSSPGFCPESID